MWKTIRVAVPFVALMGCNTVPDKPDFTLDLVGDYKAISDCAYLKFRDLQNWRRTDLDTMGQVEFAFTDGVSVGGRIYVQHVGPGRTKVVSHVQAAIWGKDYWPRRYRPIFEACAA